MLRLTTEICHLLGEPEPLEIERKFRVQKPEAFPKDCSTSLIEQTYLKGPAGEERRVRKRTVQGSSVYTYTSKRSISPGKRVERERSINGIEYLTYLQNEADTTRQTLRKLRHCFIHNRRCYELDEYLETHAGLWALEVEVEDLDKPISFPDWLTVVEEVTHNPAFSNRELARGVVMDLSALEKSIRAV